MTKQLLYIPSGRYVVFIENGGCSLEEFMEYAGKRFGEQYNDVNYIITGLCLGSWNYEVYDSAEIDYDTPIVPNEFEVVDV